MFGSTRPALFVHPALRGAIFSKGTQKGIRDDTQIDPASCLVAFSPRKGHAYSEVTSAGWQGWLTEGDIRRIEDDAIARTQDGEGLNQALPDCDPGAAIDDATELARQFFQMIRNRRKRQPIANQ